MNQDQQESPKANVLVLSDWAADVESLGTSANAVIYELLMLSLLYDKILIQDEVFALSSKLAEWLAPSDKSDLVKNLFDLNSIVILTHPESAYLHKDQDLRDRSYKYPVAARAEYIQRNSTKGERTFVPSLLQERFYAQIDTCLRESPTSRHPVRLPNQPEPTKSFAEILKAVLSSRHYRKWLDSAFSGISETMANDYLDFIENPEKAVQRAREKGFTIKLRYGPDGRPVFDRSLGYQIACIYPPKQARAICNLIQTCFAAAFCKIQNATGRYGPALRELLLLPADLDLQIEREEEIVSVEAAVDISFGLPEINSRFAEGVRSVRESDEGQKLRQSIWSLGEDFQFKDQVECWRAVADKLAMTVTPFRTVTVRTSLVTVGKRTFRGAILGGLAGPIMQKPITISSVIAGAFLAQSLGLLFDHGWEIMRNAYNRQEVREQLEHAVAFRCTTLAMPPMSLPMGV